MLPTDLYSAELLEALHVWVRGVCRRSQPRLKAKACRRGYIALPSHWTCPRQY
jgi:hypothetical protein